MSDGEPKDVILCRAAFDFLKSKDLVSENAAFSDQEAKVTHVSIRKNGQPDIRGKKICFQGGERVVINESKVVISIESDTVMIGDEDRRAELNIVRQMDLVPFPVHRYEPVNVKRPAKRSRIKDQSNIFELIPDDCVLRMFSFATSTQDILPMMNVCKRWRNLLNRNKEADVTIWKPLCLYYYPVLGRVHRPIRRFCKYPSWQTLFLERACYLKRQFRQNDGVEDDRDRFDYHDHAGAFQPLHFHAYEDSFFVVFRDKNGYSTKVKVKPELHAKSKGRLHLHLPKNFKLTPFEALKACVQHPHEQSPRVLYSGNIYQRHNGVKFSRYNQFEKFHAKSFFVGLRPSPSSVDDDIEYVPISIPSVGVYFESGDDSSFLEVYMSWQVLPQFENLVPMSTLDFLTFLEKGMVSVRDSISSSLTMNFAMTIYSPRKLSSFGLVVDCSRCTTETLPCVSDIVSQYYEACDVVSNAHDTATFQLTLPSQCQKLMPTTSSAEEYIDIAIYVVYKYTGQFAMLYQGSNTGDWEHDGATGEVYHFMSEKEDFEKFDSSTFFSVRDPTLHHHGTVPSVGGKLYTETSPPLLEVSLNWLYVETSDTTYSPFLRRADIPRFFGEGLSWGRL